MEHWDDDDQSYKKKRQGLQKLNDNVVTGWDRAATGGKYFATSITGVLESEECGKKLKAP